MRKEPSTAEQRNGAVAPKLVDLTDRIRLRDGGGRHTRSPRAPRARSVGNVSPVWEGSPEGAGTRDVATLARLIGTYAPHDGRFLLPIPGLYAIRASRPYTE